MITIDKMQSTPFTTESSLVPCPICSYAGVCEPAIVVVVGVMVMNFRRIDLIFNFMGWHEICFKWLIIRFKLLLCYLKNNPIGMLERQTATKKDTVLEQREGEMNCESDKMSQKIESGRI